MPALALALAAEEAKLLLVGWRAAVVAAWAASAAAEADADGDGDPSTWPTEAGGAGPSYCCPEWRRYGLDNSDREALAPSERLDADWCPSDDDISPSVVAEVRCVLSEDLRLPSRAPPTAYKPP
jgi:hypothetical protein